MAQISSHSRRKPTKTGAFSTPMFYNETESCQHTRTRTPSLVPMFIAPESEREERARKKSIPRSSRFFAVTNWRQKCVSSHLALLCGFLPAPRPDVSTPAPLFSVPFVHRILVLLKELGMLDNFSGSSKFCIHICLSNLSLKTIFLRSSRE